MMQKEKGNIVAEYNIKGTKVKIYDGAFVATNSDHPNVKVILKRISNMVYQNIQSK